MTVIAWDGKKVAWDSCSQYGDVEMEVAKCVRLRNGPDNFAICCGELSKCLQVCEWLKTARNPDNFPRFSEIYGSVIEFLKEPGDDFVTIMEYENQPVPIQHIQDQYLAWGCGAQAAKASMLTGGCAKEAVKVTCSFVVGCSGPIHSAILIK